MSAVLEQAIADQLPSVSATQLVAGIQKVGRTVAAHGAVLITKHDQPAYVLMSVLTRLSQAAAFRWLNAGLMVLATALVMGHQAHGLLTGISASGLCGSSTQGLFEVLRTTHHAIGILMSVLAVRWALAARKADAP